MIDGFDWDAGNSAKCQKHGVPCDEIEVLFRADHQVVPDLTNSAEEQRQLAIGRAGNRPIFVVFTIRQRDGQNLIRPISARYMHRKEIERYEQAGSSFQD